MPATRGRKAQRSPVELAEDGSIRPVSSMLAFGNISLVIVALSFASSVSFVAFVLRLNVLYESWYWRRKYANGTFFAANPIFRCCWLPCSTWLNAWRLDIDINADIVFFLFGLRLARLRQHTRANFLAMNMGQGMQIASYRRQSVAFWEGMNSSHSNKYPSSRSAVHFG